MSSGILIGFSTSKVWYSNLIRWATKAKVSHAFLLASFLGKLLVFQEGPLGYSVCTFEKFKKDNEVVALIVPKVSIEEGFKKSLAQLGQPYAYLALLGFAFVLFVKLLGWKLTHNPLSSAHSTFCSQRGAQILRDSHYPGAETLDPELTSPEDLLLFLNKQTGIIDSQHVLKHCNNCEREPLGRGP